jgi:hypothetical protein
MLATAVSNNLAESRTNKFPFMGPPQLVLAPFDTPLESLVPFESGSGPFCGALVNIRN